MIEEPLQVGHHLSDRYQIVRQIRPGSSGTVYEVRDMVAASGNRQRALKELHLEDTWMHFQEEQLIAFYEKGSVLYALNHPGLPRTYDAFQLDGRAYQVMELIKGRDLEEIIANASDPLPVAAVHQWAIELCEVLDYLHNHEPGPVIFRDVKPSNIMLDHRMKIRLIDFGIAGIFETGHTDFPLGTDGYASPEQYDGFVTPSIDIYGVGATLHHLLTGIDPRLEAPFTFEDRPISHYNTQVPSRFESIVVRALARNASFRFASAASMLNALKGVRI